MIPVTVIIPTYNRAPFLAEALRSVAAQTRRAMQVIVVDDGSDDDSESVCRASTLDIRYIPQKRCGVSAARNRGIVAADTDWIAFLDSDDLWLPEKLERQDDYISEHPDCRVLQTEEIWIRRGRRVNPRLIHQKPSGWIFEPSLDLCLVSPSAVLIHREVLNHVGLFDETLPACEDYDLWLRLALQYPVHTLREKLTIKRGGHDNQLSAQWGLDRYRVQALLKLLAEQALNEQQRSLVIQNIEKRCDILIQGFEKRGKREEVSQYLEVLKQLT